MIFNNKQISYLLGRDVENYEPVDMDMWHGKKVLITGAGGSFGRQCAMRIALCEPEKLFLLDRDGVNLSKIETTLGQDPVFQPILCDIRSKMRVRRVLRETRPDIVIHTAAHKFFNYLEDAADEAVAVNVLGTDNMINASFIVGVDTFVHISSDKAVYPITVYGATKRIAEVLVKMQAKKHKFRCFSVRFPNLLGAMGSVMDVFQTKIEKLQNIVVRGEETQRYFYTFDEAFAMIQDGVRDAKQGEIRYPSDLQPVKIIDLANRMIALYDCQGEVGVRVIDKPENEKSIELLYYDYESEVRFPGYQQAYIRDRFMNLEMMVECADSEGVMFFIKDILKHEYIGR